MTTPVSKDSLEARPSQPGLGEPANDVPMAAATSAAEVNRCSGRFSMARLRVPNRS